MTPSEKKLLLAFTKSTESALKEMRELVTGNDEYKRGYIDAINFALKLNDGNISAIKTI